ncbi:MAG: phosphoribosylaminoimidazolesuccinocarboxamide synthase [Eubacteriales bacterium]|nr:phosphoribosylaminoimidazolesuccinocarboxamide synthase [Eubacteriales bacterium]
MQKLDLMYTGKAKKVFNTTDETLCIFEYKDDATAFNGEKKGSFDGKGIINNQIANIIFKLLEKKGIPTHFVKELSKRETLVKKVNIIPLEVIVRNISAGSFAKKYGISEGYVLKSPTLEFSYKNDDLGDPLINDYHAIALDIATKEQLNKISDIAFNVNNALIEIFKSIDIKLVDFKIEVGFDSKGEIILSDEISPDTCRLWDINTNKKLDKDQFRLDLGEFASVYNEVFKRLIEKYPNI